MTKNFSFIFLVVLSTLLFLLAITFTQCSPDISQPEDQESSSLPVEVEFHLQSGFSDKWVNISVNKEKKFWGDLSPHIPLVGPHAYFTTSLPKGTNNLKIYWGSSGSETPFKVDSCEIEVVSLKKHFVGLGIYNDSLTINVQDEPFLYL